MAKVKNTSYINIIRRTTNLQGAVTIEPLGNALFNGYVYNLGLTVGLNGSPSILTLNLTLNKTLKQTKIRDEIIKERREAAESGGSFGERLLRVDNDFNIQENNMGVKASYTIQIINQDSQPVYRLDNFRIVNCSISKKDNQKILTLTFHDNSLVLDKIYVGLLGQHIALDARSEKTAVIDKIVMHCPSVNYSVAKMTTQTNFKQQMHVAEQQLSKKISIPSTAVLGSDDSNGPNKKNYITIKGKIRKTIHEGYGAVILLGEEEFKDAPCAASEVTYTFETLIAAMKDLGIEIKNDSLKDKSKGKIKKNFSGTLKNVLNQWCDEYSYSYAVDISNTFDPKTLKSKIFITGNDLSTDVSAVTVLRIKLLIEKLETDDSDTQKNTFVIQSQEFDYNLSQKKLKLYSSFYHKEARDKTHSFEENLGDLPFYSMNLRRLFPNWFSTSLKTKDFCGAQRSFDQVLTSAVLGKFSSSLRNIYNYSIGAFKALGFTYVSKEAISSRIPIANNKDLMLEQAIRAVTEISASNLFDDLGVPLYEYHFGFYNAKAVSQIRKIEDYIADFIGKHYWTDFVIAPEGSSANENVFNEFSITSSPSTQKVYFDQVHNLPIIKQAQFMTQQLTALYQGQANYSKAYEEVDALAQQAKIACELANPDYIIRLKSNEINKKLAFYTERTNAAYGVFQEMIRELEVLEYSVGNTNDLFEIPLSNIFSPTFKELSPSTIGLLQAVLPINIAKMTLGDLKFGLLTSIKPNKQIFTFQALGSSKAYAVYMDGSLMSNYKSLEADAVFVNPIEFQNQIRDYCEAISEINIKNLTIIKSRIKNNCSKTILYQVCILPPEVDRIAVDDQAKIQSAIGPSPHACRRIKITRGMPWPALMKSQITKLMSSEKNKGRLVEDDTFGLDNINIHSVRLGKSSYWTLLYKYNTVWETITLPAQGAYPLKLVSKTNIETFVPFQQFVKGGLEDSDDIKSILENDGFSVDLSLNNITPNVRELFGDQSTPRLISDTVSDAVEVDPIVMNYQGYNGDNPNYEFNTFSEFHNSLKKYYNSEAVSVRGSAVSYSADLFCSSISSGLQDILSVNNGLVGLNISLGEGGLNVRCEFNSRPVREVSMETLLYKSKPNIKFQNMNSST